MRSRHGGLAVPGFTVCIVVLVFVVAIVGSAVSIARAQTTVVPLTPDSTHVCPQPIWHRPYYWPRPYRPEVRT